MQMVPIAARTWKPLQRCLSVCLRLPNNVPPMGLCGQQALSFSKNWRFFDGGTYMQTKQLGPKKKENRVEGSETKTERWDRNAVLDKGLKETYKHQIADPGPSGYNTYSNNWIQDNRQSIPSSQLRSDPQTRIMKSPRLARAAMHRSAHEDSFRIDASTHYPD